MPVEFNTEMIDAPIPGQSLTNEPGSYPWEKPPKLNTVDEVISNYLPCLLYTSPSPRDS